MNVVASLSTAVSRALLALVLMLSLLVTPAFPIDYQDTKTFIAGYNAYQNKDYQAAIENLSLVLQKHPDSPLRDMAIFWLARAHFKAGHRPAAGRYMAQFLREYPTSPLKGMIEPELAKLAADYEAEEASRVAESETAEKAAAEKAAVEKAAAEKAAAEKAAVEKAAAEKAAAEKAAADKAAAKKAATKKNAAERPVPAKMEDTAPSPKPAAVIKKVEKEKEGEPKESMKEKAIAGYKAVIDQFPGTSAAAVAAARLNDLGIAYPPSSGTERSIAGYKSVIDRFPGSAAAAIATAKLKKLGIVYPPPAPIATPSPEMTPPPSRTATASPSAGVAQVLTLEVGQFADFDFTMAPVGQSYPAGKSFSLPFELVNRGNGTDSFSLESGFPLEFGVRFAATADPATPLTVTPRLSPGGTFSAIVTGVIPRAAIDGQKYVFPIKAGSQFASEVSKSREIQLVASAPLLRAVLKPDKATVLPGEKLTYRIALLNVGSAAADGVTLRLNYPPQCEPVDFIPAGFKQEMKGTLVIDPLRVNSGESREFSVSFQVKEDAVAHQELFLRGELTNAELESRDSFLSTAAVVRQVSGVAARTNQEKIIAIPGQTMTIPVLVTNTGNLRESFQLRAEAAGLVCRFYLDLNRDGIRQADEPAITRIGPLAPREEASLLVELATPPGATDGSEVPVGITVEPENDKGKSVMVATGLRFARPIMELAMAGKDGKLRPGDVSSFELNIVNRGSNLARVVELENSLPGNLEMMVADPPFQQGSVGNYLWKFADLGAGEKRTVRVTFRVKGGVPVGTSIQVKNLVRYEDQLGNRY